MTLQGMRYELANVSAKQSVDLRKYRTTIKSMVHQIKPDADVTVEEDCYIVNNDLTAGEARRIGQLLAQTKLGRFSTPRPVLFVGHRYRVTKSTKEEE